MENMMVFLQDRLGGRPTIEHVVDVFEEMCEIPAEDDMILFETGTFSFTGKPRFQISLVRQLPDGDGEYLQFHVNILYNPAAESGAFTEAVWNEDLDESIFDYIRKSPAFAYAKTREYVNIEIYMDET